MPEEILEVRVNLDEKYQFGEGHNGQIVRLVGPAEQDVLMDDTFGTLVNYVMKAQDDLKPDQEETMDALKERVQNDSPDNRVLIKLYDEHDQELAGEFAPGDIYLEDVVRDKLGDSPAYASMGLSVRPSVGYR